MTRPLCLMALFLALAVGCGKRATETTSVEDYACLQGTWVVKKFEAPKGTPTPLTHSVEAAIYIINDKRLDIMIEGKSAQVAVLSIDGNTSPKSIDFVQADKNGKTDAVKNAVDFRNGEVIYRTGSGKTLRGIYKLEGDTLQVALSMGSEGPRPTEFKPHVFDLGPDKFLVSVYVFHIQKK